jgi:hypothetical protein
MNDSYNPSQPILDAVTVTKKPMDVKPTQKTLKRKLRNANNVNIPELLLYSDPNGL